MARDKDDDQLYEEGEFSLESILKEFGGAAPSEPEEPSPDPEEIPAPPEDEEGDWREDTIPFPKRLRQAPVQREPEPPPQEPEERPERKGVLTAFPGARGVQPEERSEPREEKTPSPEVPKVLDFPGQEPENPVAAGLDSLRRRADEFADHMYEEASAAVASEVRKAERLIPGVDEEETPPVPRERKPRRKRPPAPDIPPAELSKRYGKGLKGARGRCALVFLLTIALFYMTLAESHPLPVPAVLASNAVWRCYTLAGIQALAVLLGFDVFVRALARPFQGRTGMDTVTALANLAVLADALTLPTVWEGILPRLPLCAPAALGLWCVLWGDLQKRRGQRMACRTAASASEPYLVTRDEGKWNNRDTYAKWSGPTAGFGSQIQGLDGAERIYRIISPLILIACLLFALMASLGQGRPGDLLWSLGAILCAAAPLASTLCFGLPWRRLSARLSKSGAALAGWEGLTNTTGGTNLLLTDTDLFPPGSVKLNGVKIFGEVSIDKVIAVTATVIRDSGSGLNKVFHDLLRSQGSVYRRGEKFTTYEGGGVSEVIRGELVLVGSAPFMVLMDVPLPQGLNVKNAVFCAINGELAGIFALNYTLSGAAPLAIDTLIRAHVTPVLATRDFNLIPSMLRQRFKLPVEKMEFPSVERRRELSAEEQSHSDTLTAVLCREGVGPYAEAVVGGRRLRTAVRLSAVLCCLGSIVGALLAFYLTFVAAYNSLTAINLTVFLLMWLVPAPLISGWVNRY